MKSLHYHFPKGKRVFIIMDNGVAFVDRYVEKIKNGIQLKKYGKLKFKNVRSVTIFRP
jgi:hypothetical protein